MPRSRHKNEKQPMLTKNQMGMLMLALEKGQPNASKKDKLAVIKWAEKTVLGVTLLDLIMAGKAILSVQNGQIRVGASQDELDAAAVRETAEQPA